MRGFELLIWVVGFRVCWGRRNSKERKFWVIDLGSGFFGAIF